MSGGDEAPRPDQSAPVPVREAHDLDISAAVRRVHHTTAANVEANVAKAVEEEDVARLHASTSDSPAVAVESVRAVRQVDADAQIAPADEPGAVEARRRFTAPAVGH